MGLLDFLSRDAGQQRRAWLDKKSIGVLDALQYYAGPGVDTRQIGGLLGMFNPVQDVGEAMGNARDGDYIGAAVNSASALAPVAAWKLAGSPVDEVTNALTDTLAGVSMKAQGAADWGGEFARAEDGMFLGPSALNADLGALDTAKRMADGGADRTAIWNDTGWFKGVDGKWRFEIDDSGIGLRSQDETMQIAGDMRENAKGLLDSIKTRNADMKVQPDLFPGDVRRLNGDLRRKADALKSEAGSNFGPEWHHTANGQRAQYAVTGPLSDAYPAQMADTIVRTEQPGGSYSGSYNGQRSQLNVTRAAENERSTLLHELQHMVQNAEGFSPGSNPQMGARVAGERIYSASMRLYDEAIKKAEALSPEGRQAFGEFLTDPDAPFAREAFSLRGKQERELLSLWDKSAELNRKAAGVPDRTAMQFYRREAGETEARNVQKRMNMSPSERKATPPWVTQDVPDTAQLTGRNRSGQQEQPQGLLGYMGQQWQ